MTVPSFFWRGLAKHRPLTLIIRIHLRHIYLETTMLIQRFFAPATEVSEIGLEEINMSRLGRFVALAGKNGAGKSRLLTKLEFYVSARLNGLPAVDQRRANIRAYAAHIANNPNDPQLNSLAEHLRSEQYQLEQTLDRVIGATETARFKAVRFVPKQLNLEDPRNHGARELVVRYGQAKTPGLAGYEQRCLYYIQQLQSRWWNAGHQLFSGTTEEKEAALADYDRFQQMLLRLLDSPLDRNVDGDATLFGRPISDSGLSDGQKIILQLCVALHAQHSELDNSIFLLDEPENHLHPSAAIDLLKALYEVADNSQIWIATHSIPLLAYVASIEPMSLWYVEGGRVISAGRRPEVVLGSLLGDEDRIGQLNAFTGLPAHLAAFNYATESLLPPRVVSDGVGDPQVAQIRRIVGELSKGDPFSILDYGAGKGRLLEGMGAEFTASEQRLAEFINYFAFDPFSGDQATCQRVIDEYFQSGCRRYFNTPDEFFSHKDDASIDVVVMCNVFHEISPRQWLELFSVESLIMRALKDEGYLLIVEDQRIPTGEKAHDLGFIVLDTAHLRTLFSVKEEDLEAERFSCADRRGDGRLKAHLISKLLLNRITHETRRRSIDQLKTTAKENIKRLRGGQPSYANGQMHGFWTQQFANASLFIDEA